MWRRNSGDIDGAGDGCATKRVVKTECRTEESDSGRLIRKCEKTEQLLRQCAGRAAEVVKSNTEYSEEDVTDETINNSPLELKGSFAFPGLRSDIEALESNMFGNINRLMDAAEEMAKEFFGGMERPFIFDQEPSAHSRRIPDRFSGREGPSAKPTNKSAYGEFASKATDV